MVGRAKMLLFGFVLALLASTHGAAAAQSCQSTSCASNGSRWVAGMPFGVGQFQNGDYALGAVFLVTEVTLVGASIALWVMHDGLRDERVISHTEIERIRNKEAVLRLSNWAAMMLLGGTAIAGVVEAQLSFGDWPATVAIGPGSASLAVPF